MYRIKFVIVFCLFLLFMLKSCFEFTDKTKIHRDGSIEKIIIFSEDSTTVKQIMNGEYTALPLPLDKQWTTGIEIDKNDSSNFIYKAHRIFKTDELVNRALIQNSDSLKKIVPQISVDKKFRWFYTYYYFKEIYPYYGFKQFVSIDEYLSEEQKQLYYQNGDSSNVENMVNQWMKKNVYTYFEIEMTRAINELSGNSMDLEKLRPIEDSLQTIIEGVVELEDLSESTTKIMNLLARQYGRDELKGLRQPLKNILFELQKVSTGIMSLIGEFNVVVEMPGILLATNSNIIEGNVVKWEFSHDRFSLEDFEMTAHSRILNGWAVIVTFLVILLLFGLWVFRFKKTGRD